MSHATRLVTALAIAAALAACAAPASILPVQAGMTRSEIVAALGEPESVGARDGAELMYYTRCHANCAAKGFENRRNVTYEVRLVNGKVESAQPK
jgi:hypothetical protein